MLFNKPSTSRCQWGLQFFLFCDHDLIVNVVQGSSLSAASLVYFNSFPFFRKDFIEMKGQQTDKRADVLMFEYLKTVSFTSSRWFSKLLLLLSWSLLRSAMARKANTSVNFSNLHTEQDWEELCKRQVVFHKNQILFYPYIKVVSLSVM